MREFEIKPELDKKLIKLSKKDKGRYEAVMKKITPLGINTVEDQPEFKKNFGFEVNLGLLKFSWGASEK